MMLLHPFISIKQIHLIAYKHYGNGVTEVPDLLKPLLGGVDKRGIIHDVVDDEEYMNVLVFLLSHFGIGSC